MKQFFTPIAFVVSLALLPAAVSARSGFLPGENNVALDAKTSAEFKAQREKRVEARKKRRDARKLRREQRTTGASN